MDKIKVFKDAFKEICDISNDRFIEKPRRAIWGKH